MNIKLTADLIPKDLIMRHLEKDNHEKCKLNQTGIKGTNATYNLSPNACFWV